MKYTVEQKDAGIRLDKFLNEKISNQSRSQIQKMIKQGWVLVDGKIVSPHYFLKAGQMVMVTEKQLANQIAKRPTGNLPQTTLTNKNNSLEPKIIATTADYLVLDKPAGLLVYPTDKGETDTLADWLKIKHPEILSIGEEKYRGGIIHRIDKEASGIVLACRSQKMYEHLKEQFKRRLVYKEYIALVYGQIEKDEGEINFPIGRSRVGFKMAAHPKTFGHKFKEQDRLAISLYEVIERIKNYTLLKVVIKTGRTHQIRVHLNAFGHPIVGDQIYKIKRFWQIWIKKPKLDRIFLHAAKIGFNDLAGQWQLFESPLPPELNNFLNEIKK